MFISCTDSAAARQITDFSLCAGDRPSGHLACRPTARRSCSMPAFGATPISTLSPCRVGRRNASRRVSGGAHVVPVWSPDGAWIVLHVTTRRAPANVAGRARRRFGGAGHDASGFRCAVFARRPVPADGRERGANTSLGRRPVQGGPEEPALVDEQGQSRTVVQFAFWRPTQKGIIYL